MIKLLEAVVGDPRIQKQGITAEQKLALERIRHVLGVDRKALSGPKPAAKRAKTSRQPARKQ
jgi:hypothetical protein